MAGGSKVSTERTKRVRVRVREGGWREESRSREK
jgi:hypothetical protein